MAAIGRSLDHARQVATGSTTLFWLPAGRGICASETRVTRQSTHAREAQPGLLRALRPRGFKLPCGTGSALCDGNMSAWQLVGALVARADIWEVAW